MAASLSEPRAAARMVDLGTNSVLTGAGYRGTNVLKTWELLQTVDRKAVEQRKSAR